MIHTEFPYGSIAESQVGYISHTAKGPTLVDNLSNQWLIDEETFKRLKKNGYTEKEVFKKK